MKVQLAYLTSPEADVFRLNIQPDNWTEPMQFDVSSDQLGNIVTAYLALKRQSSNRVPYKTREHRAQGER